MLFSTPSTTGDLQIDEMNVQMISSFKKVVWSVPRASVMYIALKKGALKADLIIYTAQNHYPANFLTKQNAEKFLTFFPSVPVGDAPSPTSIQQQVPLAVQEAPQPQGGMSFPPSWQPIPQNPQPWPSQPPRPQSYPVTQEPPASPSFSGQWDVPQQPVPQQLFPNSYQQTDVSGQLPPQYPQQSSTIPPYRQQPYEQMLFQQQQPPKRKLSRRTWAIIAAVVVVIVIISAISSAVQDNNSSTKANPTTAPAQSQAAPTDVPTQAPTAAPTTKPKPTLGSQTAVGNTVDAFTAKFGSSASQKSDSNGGTTFQYQNVNNNVGTMDVITFPNSQTLVLGVVLAPPAGQSWDATTALTVCISFIPEDGKIDNPKSITDSAGIDVGLYQGGSSVELADTLPSSDFLNADTGSTVTPGTFSTIYSYVAGSNGTQVDACGIQVGVQSTTTLSQN